MPPLFSLCCDSNVKYDLIFSDETGEKPSPIAQIKTEETVRLPEKCAESVNAAAPTWQNCLFSDSATSSSFFFFPACLWKSLHIHGPPVLRSCHRACYTALPSFLFRMAFGGRRNTPSDLTVSS